MDIAYLLTLQDFRNSTNDLLTPFLEGLSLFAGTYLILFPMLVYWMLDKRSGLYILTSLCSALTVNAAVKLTACVYRPWIRDARVLPAGDAITTATGYSFPSGHTMTAGPIYGGLALCAWKKWKWASILFLLLLALTAFSRNYLGVHTPQDVLVGLLLSALMLYLTRLVFRAVDADPSRERWFLLGGFLFGWAVIAYITFKSYPMDYVDGKLLVDPQKMMNDGYGDSAKLIAFCVARAVERRWIRFRPAGFTLRSTAVCAAGAVGLLAMIMYLGAPLDAALGSHWGHFASNFILFFYGVALVPLFLKLTEGKREDPAPARS